MKLIKKSYTCLQCGNFIDVCARNRKAAAMELALAIVSHRKECVPTKYAPDVASAASAEPDSGLESVSVGRKPSKQKGI